MAVGYNPRIVTDGLLFCVDAGNTKSHSGSGTTWNDISGKGNTLTATNSPTFSSSGGGSIEFNGTDDLYTIDNNFVSSDQILTGSSTAYTLEAWINVHTSQGTATDADSIVGNTSSYGVGMQVGVSNGNPRMNYGARSTSNFSGNEFSYNTWTHVCLTKPANSNPTSYMNGEYENSSTSLFVSDNQTIGNMTIGNSSPRISGFYDGLIAVVRIYNKALTASEVKQNFNALRGRFGI